MVVEMSRFGVREYTEEDYKEFFEWLLEREVNMNQMIDITLLDSHEEPKVYYPDEIKMLLETKAMQRLKRVAQLGSLLFANDDDFQTRFSHSVGTGNNAQKFFIKLYNDNSEWKKYIETSGKKEEIFADIIQMYVHDIGHNVLSHTLENLIKSNSINHQKGAAHEILGIRIINEDFEIKKVLMAISPTFIETFNRVTEDNYDLKTLKEGSVDFDRLDYLIRDKMYSGGFEDRDITEKLINYYDIIIQEDGVLKQIPVLDEKAQEVVHNFLIRRKVSYENSYFSNQSLALDKIAIYFCEKIAIGDYKCDLKRYILDCIQNGGNGIDLDEFRKWDDTRFYKEVIDIAQNHPNEDMRKLAITCLPSLKGLTNFIFEAYELDYIKSLNQLSIDQRKVLETVRNLVTNKTDLHDALLKKEDEDFVVLDAKSKEDINQIFDELEKEGISRKKLYSLLSWSKKRKIYDPLESIYLKAPNGEIKSIDEYIVFTNDMDNIEVNGVLALPMQMKENSFSEKEIKIVQEKFKDYNDKRKEKFQKKKKEDEENKKYKKENKVGEEELEEVSELYRSTLMDSIECANNIYEHMEL